MADAAASPPLRVGASDHPLKLDLEAPFEVANWRPLVQWFLAIPHLLVMSALQMLTSVMTFIAFFAILFTKTYPEGMFNIVAMSYRYQWRVYSYVTFMRETYPPFEFELTGTDPGTDPARYSVEYPNELNRWLPLVKFILAIPHFFVIVFRSLVATIVGIGAFFTVLFTGRYPERMRTYIVDVYRYTFRVQSYVMLMRDEYPPFAMK